MPYLSVDAVTRTRDRGHAGDIRFTNNQGNAPLTVTHALAAGIDIVTTYGGVGHGVDVGLRKYAVVPVTWSPGPRDRLYGIGSCCVDYRQTDVSSTVGCHRRAFAM
jgi:hypothetical protein